jgi:D-glucuronyl C5-epimerase C-terminus
MTGRSTCPRTCAVLLAAVLTACTVAVAEAHAARTVGSELNRMYREGSIDAPTRAATRAAYRSARTTARRLTGARRVELGGAVRTVEGIAARGALTPSRLTPLTLTLERNTEWWTTRELLGNGARVTFPGSQLVWQMFSGQGLQFHPLANFGKLNGYFLGGRKNDAAAGQLMTELLAMASERAGGVAWEYYFAFGGGLPPWVSGMSQGTALQALTRVATRLGRQAEVFPVAARGLTVFEQPTPSGVRVDTPEGTHYALYSFAPGLRVLNGFVQALVGLYDYASLTGDQRGRALFDAGSALARVDVPRYDTGAWSLYARGTTTRESDLSYHVLLRDFLTQLCRRTRDPVYCNAESHLTLYLTQPPVLTLRTLRVRARATTPIRFDLSKISRVGMTITRADGRGGAGAYYTRAALTFPRGRHALWWPVPKRRGLYTVRLTGTDLNGNPGATEGVLEVLPVKKRPAPK